MTMAASSGPIMEALIKATSSGNNNYGGLLSSLGSSSGGGTNSILGKFGGIANMFGQAGDEAGKKEAAQAYQGYLNSIANKMANELEARAEKYDTKLQNQFNEAEPQYQQEANTALPELAKLQQDTLDQNTEAQRLNRRQIEATMARQGIRGGQAGILENRALGEQARDAQRDINQLAYNEALNRQNSRLGYYSQKALTPWSTMSNAYGNSMVGANNSLSSAQGNVYARAYDNAMKNYVDSYSPQNKTSKWGNALSGAASGAAAGSTFGPWGAAIGGLAGGAMGYFKK